MAKIYLKKVKNKAENNMCIEFDTESRRRCFFYCNENHKCPIPVDEKCKKAEYIYIQVPGPEVEK